MAKFRFLLWLLLLSFATSPTAIVAWAAPYARVQFGKVVGLPHPVVSSDGVELTLYEMEGNDGGEAFLLQPGVLESAQMLSTVAEHLHAAGKKVFIGEVRLSGRPGQRLPAPDRLSLSAGKEGLSSFSDEFGFHFVAPAKGLGAVALRDFPAHVRAVHALVNARRAAGTPTRKLSVFAHSLGGLEVLASFSDEALGPELASYVKSVSLVAVPHEFQSLSARYRLEAIAMVPALRAVRQLLGVEALGPHVTLFDLIEKLRTNPNRAIRASARAVEYLLSSIAATLFNHGLIDSKNVSEAALRRIWARELTALPVELMIDLAEAAVQGEFLRPDGSRLIAPERLKVPVQVVAAENDILASIPGQLALFDSLGSAVKQFVVLFGMRHVDPVVSDKPGTDFSRLIIEFHDDPVASTENARIIGFKGGAAASIQSVCEGYLALPDELVPLRP